MPKRDKRKNTKMDQIRSGYSPNELIRLVRAGREYFELLEKLIQEAKHTIHLQTYIFDGDDTGKRVAQLLVEAVQRKVKVFMIVDGYASQELSDDFVSRLREGGVYFRFFNPLLISRNFYFGRRLHHKIVVADGRRSLVGGINIGNNYNDTTQNLAWLDWALYMEGTIGWELQRICEVRLRNSLIKSLNRTAKPPVQESQEGKDLYLVRPRVNDWVRRRREVTRSYLEMLTSARSHVVIISSYFLPGKLVRRHLKAAAKRGVNVKVIVAGISDVRLAKNAERYTYRWLLKNNIEIYEYQRKVLHAKLATYDSKWVTVGSYNVNNMSAYASVELNMDVLNDDFAKDVEHRLKRIIETDCIQITNEIYHAQSLWKRFLQRGSYELVRFILFIFTFYLEQRE